MSGEKDLRPELTRLATSLGAELHWQFVPSAPKYRYLEEFTIAVGGAQVVVRARTGSKGALVGASFTIEVSVPLIAAPVTMRREHWLDRLGKNLFINREFQFGDEEFDRAVYIESDASDASLQRLLSAFSVRVAIANLVCGIADHVEVAVPPLDVKPALVNPDRVQRSISVVVLTSKLGQRDAIITLMQTLAHLGREAQQERARERHPVPLEPVTPRRIGGIAAALAVSFSTWVATWLLAALASGPATVGWRAYERGMSTGVAFWICALVISIALFRGRSTSLRLVIGLAILWLGLVPLSGQIGERVNAQWDHGPRTSLAGTVAIHRGSKGPVREHVIVPSLGGKDLVVPDEVVSSALRVSTTPSPARVVVGEGALGSKWIVAVEPPAL